MLGVRCNLTSLILLLNSFIPLDSAPKDRNQVQKTRESSTETLDSLLESLAFENFTTNIQMVQLMKDEPKATTFTNNPKTDTLNRYFDNLINFNRECEKSNKRKSESSSSSSDYRMEPQNGYGKVPFHQVKHH